MMDREAIHISLRGNFCRDRMDIQTIHTHLLFKNTGHILVIFLSDILTLLNCHSAHAASLVHAKEGAARGEPGALRGSDERRRDALDREDLRR